MFHFFPVQALHIRLGLCQYIHGSLITTRAAIVVCLVCLRTPEFSFAALGIACMRGSLLVRRYDIAGFIGDLFCGSILPWRRPSIFSGSIVARWVDATACFGAAARRAWLWIKAIPITYISNLSRVRPTPTRFGGRQLPSPYTAKYPRARNRKCDHHGLWRHDAPVYGAVTGNGVVTRIL